MEDKQTPIIAISNSHEVQQDVVRPTLALPPKNSKKFLWVLGATAILAIVVAIIFAILYFTKPTSEQPTAETPTSKEESPISADSGEVEITDTYILRDLDEKMSILHNTTETGSLIKKPGNGISYIFPLYKDGNLSEIAKLSHLAYSLKGDYSINYDALQSIISEQGYDESIANSFYNAKAIKGETMAAKYLDTYGEQLDKGAANNQVYCPGIFYNFAYDFYYDPVLGCGGTSPYTVLIYKNKYTTDTGHAYVYVSVGTINMEDDKVYCDIIDTDAPLPSICAESVPDQEQIIHNTNYQDFAEYRFIFNQANNGTYYFVKAEKL